MNSKCYTMAVREGAAEIVMYGEIVERRPVDFTTGEEAAGSFIIRDEFLADLERLTAGGGDAGGGAKDRAKSGGGVKSLLIRMDSVGGDAGVSVFIHNRLRELAAAGVTLRCVIEGVAMSGGSLIACACDRVEMYPASLLMIHNAWSFLFGCYNAGELLEAAARCEAWDRAQAAVYERKTGLPVKEIQRLMAETTYMAGAEAAERGFADAVLEDGKALRIAASAARDRLCVNGRWLRVPPGSIPAGIETVTTEAGTSGQGLGTGGHEPGTDVHLIPSTKPSAPASVVINQEAPGEENGAEERGGRTLAGLQNVGADSIRPIAGQDGAMANVGNDPAVDSGKLKVESDEALTPSAQSLTPELGTRGQGLGTRGSVPLTPDAEAAAVAERERIRAIDEIAGLFSAAEVADAKYGNVCDARELAFRAAQKAAQTGRSFMKAAAADTEESGVQSVDAAAAPETGIAETGETKMNAARAKVKAVLDARC